MEDTLAVAITGMAAGERRGILAAGLAKRFAAEGKRTLVVDAADNSVSGRALGVSPSPATPGFCDLVLKCKTPEQVVMPTPVERLWYLAPGPGLMDVDQYAEAERKHLFVASHAAVRRLRRHHDVVILDTGDELADPSTFCALSGATQVLIASPTRPADVLAVATEIGDVAIVRRGFSPLLQLAGIVGLAPLQERTGLFGDYEATVNEAYDLLLAVAEES
jgi:MinD-like ATPase involved in chromosome partitioning or flagellar assembly